MSTVLATPADLTGTLLVLCLPLRPGLPGDDLPTVPAPGEDLQPFLPARSTGEADREPRRWAWPQSRLVAYRTEFLPPTAASPTLGFGRSVATVEEEEEGDQPVFRRESSCASLWQVPGRGLVLVLERLRPLMAAEQIDELAASLREGHEESLFRELAGPLVPYPSAPVTLGALLGSLRADLPVDEPLSTLLVHRPYVTRGARHVEGLFVALAAGAGRTVADLSDRALDEDDFEQVDRMQQQGHFWSWSSREFATEPAQRGATIAAREDGRAAFVDLEAMSIYHDYLGVGGDTIVLEALPLVAERAAEAADFWIADEAVSVLSEDDPKDLTKRLRAVRGVRARLEQRAAVQELRHSVERFTTWTHGGRLWSLLHEVAAEHEVGVRLPDERTSRAIELADSMLRDIDRERKEKDRRAREKQEADLKLEQEEHTMFLQRVTTAMTAVAGLIGAVVLFTALAAIPQDGDRAIEPLLRAGFIATAVGVGLSAVAYLWLLLADRRRPRNGRTGWAVVGSVVVAAAVALTTAGGIAPQALGPVPLFLAWGLALAGGTLVTVSAPLTRARS